MPQPNLTPVKNATPREQFQAAADNITKHRNLLDQPEFERAISFGLLEYQMQLANQVRDGNSAMAVGFRLQGALELLGIIRNLSEKPTMMPKIAERGLNHQA